jgi:hypothetical protein
LVLRAAWQRLFLRYKGKLLMSGATPGTVSWYRTDDQPGGLFTAQFLSKINDTIEKLRVVPDPETARWSIIFNKAKARIQADSEHSQQPQGEKQISVYPVQ